MEGGDGNGPAGTGGPEEPTNSLGLVMSEPNNRPEQVELVQPTSGPPAGMCECAICGEFCIKKKKSSYT